MRLRRRYMADIKWTPSQKEAIYAEDKNILVSAAAGSGKTAVLVERVLRKVLNEKDPKEIDTFVIITFTKAAAAQMRDKIRSGLNRALKNDPGNDYIKRQILKLHTARICTIDSLCLDIVRENFHAADMDPAFRMASPEETDIIKKTVLDKILEENYASKKRDGSKEAFIEFVESYIGKDDRKIGQLIEKIYRFAQSDAEPAAWMDKAAAVYKSAASLGADGEVPALWDYFKEYIIRALCSVKNMAGEGLAISKAPGGPSKYIPLFAGYEDMASRMTADLKAGNVMFSRLKEELELAVPERAPAYSARTMEKEGVDPGLKEAAKTLLDECRKAVKDELTAKFFRQSMEEHYEDLAGCADAAQTLISITKDFAMRFEAEKKARKIAGFSDVSHAALKILIRHNEEGFMVRGKDGSPVYTETADAMARGITEIIVDEYQDTNMLQEYIINALSAERFGRPDVFMVGDMKQSIYRFRFAVPKLFTDKYDLYADKDGACRVILGNNFRSRPEILEFVNFIFGQIMTKETGDIDYADGNALAPSPAYEEKAPEDKILPEVYIIEAPAAGEGKKCEAHLVCSKIEELAGRMDIEEDGKMRRLRYGDIAVLSSKNEMPEIEAELKARRIPHIKSSGKGFFDTFEISLLINLLKITDNPYQDIPFAAVLRSPAAGFDADDLAVLKIHCDEKPFSLYKAALKYIERTSEEVPFKLPKEKEAALRSFMEKLEEYQNAALYMSASGLIDFITDDLNLYDIFAAMSGGSIRTANIDIFYDMAAAYERSGYAGLFDFLRYLENLRKNGYERGEASASVQGEDAVSLMTIHKSKGLEFPVVFLINTGNMYAEGEAGEDIILDKDLGLGVDRRFTGSRVKKATIAKNIIAGKIRAEGRAEQMRVLYVALTRAKTKLIVTGTAKKTAALKKDEFPDEGRADARSVMACTSHLSLIMLALSNGYKNVCSLRILTPAQVMEQAAEESLKAAELKNALVQMAQKNAGRGGENMFAFEYPHKEAAEMPVKITPSSLEKHKEGSFSEEKTPETEITDEGDIAQSFAVNAGAVRGNAYHRFFEILDYGKAQAGAAYLLEKAAAEGLIKPEEAQLIDPEKIDIFLKSSLGVRMGQAAERGTLRREQPYVMGVECCGEMQLVQGIIDAFFEEDGAIVLVDYKTDRGKTAADFIETYKSQTDSYAAAIEKATGKPVKEKLIYSVELGRTVEII